MVGEDFQIDKFRDRIVCRGAPIVWPSHSSKLNLLDFHFWTAARKEVYSVKPGSIDSRDECLKDFAGAFYEHTIRNVCNNVLMRARHFLLTGDGFFQHIF